jgi:hypothetical protein
MFSRTYIRRLILFVALVVRQIGDKIVGFMIKAPNLAER